MEVLLRLRLLSLTCGIAELRSIRRWLTYQATRGELPCPVHRSCDRSSELRRHVSTPSAHCAT